MKDAPSTDPVKLARDALGTAYADLTAAMKRALAEDSKIFFGAGAAVDLAVESLLPPHLDTVLAAQSCREALELVTTTRAYATRASGGSMATLLEDTNKRIEYALKLLAS
jgi:hypothetical protein